jgi:adenosylcobinamide-GDP ribazoletransferase
MPALRDHLNQSARRFALALQRATRLRLGGSLAPPPDPDAALVRASDAHLPGVGWIVGLAACLSFALLALALRGNPWAPPVAAVGCIMVTLFLTRAQAERALAAATDPLALYMVTAGKIVAIAAIAAQSEAGVIAAQFAAQPVSRASALLVAHWLEAENKAEPVPLRTGGWWTLVPLLLLIPAGGPAFLAAAIVTTAVAIVAMYRYCRGRELGLAGPVGAVQQVCELAFYVGAAIAAR